MIFVTGRSKRTIEDHFDVAFEFEAELTNANKTALIDLVRSVVPKGMNCAFVRQPKMLGLGTGGAVRRTLGGRRAVCGAAG